MSKRLSEESFISFQVSEVTQLPTAFHFPTSPANELIFGQNHRGSHPVLLNSEISQLRHSRVASRRFSPKYSNDLGCLVIEIHFCCAIACMHKEVKPNLGSN